MLSMIIFMSNAYIAIRILQIKDQQNLIIWFKVASYNFINQIRLYILHLPMQFCLPPGTYVF